MPSSFIALQRLYQQGISNPRFTTPASVVTWLGAVQSQEYQGAQWSLGMRIGRITDQVIDQAFNAGDILRVHVMRPTWHFVTPADIYWMQELTALRVKMRMAYYDRQWGIEQEWYPRSRAVFERVLVGGKSLTRTELAKALSDAGIPAEGSQVGHLLMSGELEGLLASGPRRGKQFTYALLAESAPQVRRLERDEALAELTLRYFTGHGPATPRDFAWWSGLTVTDGKNGIAMLGSALEKAEIDGQELWFSAEYPPTAQAAPEALLLPTYDEFLVGYDGFDKTRRAGGAVPAGNTFLPSFLMGDQVAGSWRRSLQKGGISFEIAPFAGLSPEQCDAVGEAAQRYAEFIGMPVIDLTFLKT